MHISNQLEQIFGTSDFGDGLFNKWPIGIRFELGADWGNAPHHFYTQRFYQAIDRAKTILQEIFKNTQNLHVILTFTNQSTLEAKILVKDLINCGFTLPDKYVLNSNAGIIFNDKITSANTHAILWAIISNEIGVKPTAQIKAYFIDLEKAIVAHPYDDRGMDVIAIDKDNLLPIYNKFGAWILDYDKEKIDKTFSS